MSVLLALQGVAAEQHSGSVVLTGGGTVVISASKGALLSLTLTGGGTASVVSQKDGRSLVTLTGAGIGQIAVQKGAQAVLAMHGGGTVTMATEAFGADGAQQIIVEVDLGGKSPARRYEPTPYDDYTLAEDDEACLALLLTALVP